MSDDYPDFQEYARWLGDPLVQATGLALGAGSHTDGPFTVSNFASVIVALKPTGGTCTVTVKQTVLGGPASLVLSESVIVAAGATLFEAFVLFGSAVELDLQGSAPGETVDYALYPSNTTTNAQVITQATIGVQHNDVLVANEAAIDLEDSFPVAFTVVDDPPGGRVKITPIATVAPMRKTTSKTVVNTTTETDLLNGEITIPAGALSTNRSLRARVLGDILMNEVGNVQLPRFKLKLGATTLIDTGAGWSVNAYSSATRYPMLVEFWIDELGATNAQFAGLRIEVPQNNPAGATVGIGNQFNSPGALGVWVTNGAAAVDTTAALALVLSVINPQADNNYSTRLQSAEVFVE